MLWVAGPAAGAAADSPPTSPSPAGSGVEIDEIVVTAQKREERLQDVPLSVGVVEAETLGALRLNEVTDLQNLVPGLSQTNAAGPRSFGFFVRGIGTTSFSSESIESSTAFVLDGVVLGQAGAALTDLPDVERVEVLRGPQGTLFGKNASAGVISLTTRRPSEQWQSRGSLSLAHPESELKASALVTGPISETARFLVSGRVNRRDGYVENRFDGRRLNDRDDYGARAKLELTPTENLSVLLIGDSWRRNADCCIWSLRSVGPAPSLVPEQEQIAAGIVPGRHNESQNINGDVFANTKSHGTSAQIDYDFAGGHVLSSITAWRRWLTFDGLDSDNTPGNLLDRNFSDFQQQQWTQELRITSPERGRVDYVAGLFYFDSDVDSASTQVVPTVPVPFFSHLVNTRASTRNIAAFGQANVHVTDALTLIGGARVLREEAKASKRRLDPLTNQRDGARDSKRDEAIVWRGGVQYAFTPELMAFATVTRGYKGGGFDTNIALATLPEVEAEEPINYEIGVRSAWADQRLIVNLTAFSTDVENYQTTARDPEQESFYIRNAQARTRGVEFELLARPFAAYDLTIALAGAYVDARWRNFADAPCFFGQSPAQGCAGTVQDLSDEPLPFAPKWTFGANVGWSWSVGADYRVRVDLNASYRTRTGLQFPNSPFAIQSGYALLNGAVAFGPADGRWTLSLYGKNLADRSYAALMFPTLFGAPPGGISHFVPYEARRVVGVALDVAF